MVTVQGNQCYNQHGYCGITSNHCGAVKLGGFELKLLGKHEFSYNLINIKG